MELISALRFLNVPQIPADWVEAVWDLEFTETKPLDDTIEEELRAGGADAFQNLQRCLLSHAAELQSDGSSQSVWALLVENGLSIKSLVAVLSHVVLTGKEKMANTQERVCGLQAASVYLLLLGIPGSIINQVFHEVLLDTCSDLTAHCFPHDSGKKRKKDGVKSSQADGKRSKPPRKRAANVEVDDDEEEEEELHFSASELVKIRDAAVLLIQSLLRLLQTFSLKDRRESVSTFTQIFSKLLYFEPHVGDVSFAAEKDVTRLRSVPEMAFYGLQLLCSPKHGDEKKSLRTVFQHLLYVILMMNKGSRGKHTPLPLGQAVVSIRNQTIQFICHLVAEQKQHALPLLHILLQHICVQMVEKSEVRGHAAQAVGMLTAQMTNLDYAHFIKWLLKFSRHSKMVSRLFSMDVAMVLLDEPERSPDQGLDPELSHFLQHRFLIQCLLFTQQLDASPSVQSHALSCLAQCLELPSHNVTQAVHELFSATGTQTMLEGETTTASHQTQRTYHTVPFRTVELSNDFDCDANEGITLLLRRVKDSKTNVRKSALQALMSLLKYQVIPSSWSNLTVLWERCRDPSVSVRRKALKCVGDLLASRPECVALQKAWLHGVCPAVSDPESSMQDKALEALDQVLLAPVRSYSAGGHTGAGERLSWDLLCLLCYECHDLSPYFSRAFTIWSKQDKFTPTFVSNVISHTESAHADGAWLLLSKMVRLAPGKSFNKILDAWDQMVSSKGRNVRTHCLILCVIGNVAAHLNQDTKDRIVSDLMSWLKTFTSAPEVISAAAETLYLLGCSPDVKQTQAFMSLHGGELMSLCENHLSSVILKENTGQELDEELMVKHLHTLGVMSLHCPARVGKRTVLLVVSVLTTPPDHAAAESPEELPLSQFKANSLPTRVRAHAVITLGKFCLQHEELLHKYLPVFARELEVGREVAVRNNVVVVLCDLCVRYTTILDQYVPNLSACLHDADALIRKQTLIMLTHLLQEDFVKFKGSLFFSYIAVLIDPVPAIASLCEYSLVHLLLKKSPELFTQNFIDCIFHFNSSGSLKTFNKPPQSQCERSSFSLKGAESRDKRFHIYRFLLKHLTDGQRGRITNKIVLTVLACFAEEELPLDADAAAVLSDTFQILSLKEIKLQAAGSLAGGEDPEEENQVEAVTKAALVAAQKKVVAQVQKKAFIQNALPVIISLKSLLEQKRSPVLKDLMSYLQVTVQDYHSEVKLYFSGDEQLLAELEFELKNGNAKADEWRTETDGAAPNTQGSVLRTPVQNQPLGPAPGLRSQTASGPGRLSLGSRRTYRSTGDDLALTMDRMVLAKTIAAHRAISTPKGGNLNLTFDDVSAIFSDQEMGQDVPAPEQRQALHLRQWNVQSPLANKKTRRRTK